MNNLLIETSYFGIVLSLLTYWLAVQIRKRWSYSLLNPLLISAFLTIFVLYVLDIDFQTYNQGAQMITYLLTPSTVCLAIPLYKQIKTQYLFKDISTFKKEFTDFLIKKGYRSEALNLKIEGIKIKKMKVYSSERNIKNLKIENMIFDTIDS